MIDDVLLKRTVGYLEGERKWVCAWLYGSGAVTAGPKMGGVQSKVSTSIHT
jgi:hypothetical protein